MKFTTRQLGQTFEHLPTTESTQTYLKSLLQQNRAPLGTLILTDYQQAGKGTQGRTWFSLPKPQLMFSMLIKPNLAPQKLPLVNILCGILMAQSLEDLGIVAQVKWPNDIYIDGKKVGGILSELITHENQAKVIVGIGMNIEAQESDFPSELKTIATAASLHTTTSIDRHKLLNAFLLRLESALDHWSADQLIAYCKHEFERLWVYRDRRINVQQESKSFSGIAKSINSSGALELVTEQGVEKIIGGTISVA